MERITVEVSVICPTHQQLIGYLEARHWYMVARRQRTDGATYSRWQMHEQHHFIDIHESPQFSGYYLSQKDAVILLTIYDNWLDEYSLVVQLLRGGIIGQDTAMPHLDKMKGQFSDMGTDDNVSPTSADGFWQAREKRDKQ